MEDMDPRSTLVRLIFFDVILYNTSLSLIDVGETTGQSSIRNDLGWTVIRS